MCRLHGRTLSPNRRAGTGHQNQKTNRYDSTHENPPFKVPVIISQSKQYHYI
jgi:hypothetical protein